MGIRIPADGIRRRQRHWWRQWRSSGRHRYRQLISESACRSLAKHRHRHWLRHRRERAGSHQLDRRASEGKSIVWKGGDWGRDDHGNRGSSLDSGERRFGDNFPPRAVLRRCQAKPRWIRRRFWLERPKYTRDVSSSGVRQMLSGVLRQRIMSTTGASTGKI